MQKRGKKRRNFSNIVVCDNVEIENVPNGLDDLIDKLSKQSRERERERINY